MKKFTLILASLLLATLSVSAAVVPPSYPGGEEAMQKFIKENLKYPEMSKEMGIEGVVNVQFTVKADGSIGSIKIVRMIDPDLEQEAIRLVKTMPSWTPATDNGSPVDATATVAIPFTLE
ncbi:MAG: energy transducer TonB [Muribaculaceae bacterium]|nr:energy transducer TonB [Muribaculaceae bacterium]